MMISVLIDVIILVIHPHIRFSFSSPFLLRFGFKVFFRCYYIVPSPSPCVVAHARVPVCVRGVIAFGVVRAVGNPTRPSHTILLSCSCIAISAVRTVSCTVVTCIRVHDPLCIAETPSWRCVHCANRQRSSPIHSGHDIPIYDIPICRSLRV